MEHVLLWGVAAGLVASWIYIIVLKARIRDCRGYIRDRIERANPEVQRWGGQGHQEVASQEPIHASQPRPSHSESSPPESLTPTDKLRSPLDGPGPYRPFRCLCSQCSQTFLLPDGGSLEESVREVLRTLKEHVEQEHSHTAPAGKSSG